MPKEGEGGEKTESPSAKKRKETRDEGNVAKSQEIGHVVVLLAGVVFLRFYVPHMYGIQRTFMETVFSRISSSAAGNTADYIPLFQEAIFTLLRTAFPVSVVILISGVLASLGQVGFMFTLKPLQPKLSKINPIKGLGKLFSMRSVVETLKNILKLIIISSVAYAIISGSMETFARMAFAPVSRAIEEILLLAYTITIRIVITLIIIAIIDYAYQRYDHEQNIKMTKQEVKEENKQQEGDPEVKKRIRQLQQEAASRRMMEELPEATVVVTNPTHISIAIKYTEDMEAPTIVAKGIDITALRIRERAAEYDIPLVEDVPLARALYKKVELGQQIPLEFFDAVAELLAYVYKLQGKV
ncbi:MAG: flagellar biosynthesis protein FlhB [Fibrobacterota bacterium]